MYRTYIAGPMRGVPLYNFPAFDAAEEELWLENCTPVNPARLDREAGFDPARDLPDDWDWNELPDDFRLRDTFNRDMTHLGICDAIWLLPGWRQSKGAMAEYHAAVWLGLNIIDTDPPQKGVLPACKQARKETPIYSGLLQYFPRACAAVARLSYVANEQHNPGEPMHWAREKSTDHPDCLMRHLMEAGTVDDDGQRHTAKVAWRALAMLELELESA